MTAGLVLAFAGSRANITRTLLSCAGIVVGVGSLIAVVTAGHVGERYAVAYSEINFGRAATFQVDLGGVPSDLEAFESDLRRAGARSVSMTTWVNGLFLRSGTETVPEPGITLVDAELGEIRTLEMTRGRWFTEGDQRSLAPVLVVNESLAEVLEGDARLQIGADRWVDARVVGVLADSGMDPGWHSAYLLRSPAGEAILPEPEPGTMSSYSVLVDPADADPDAYLERLGSASWRWGLPETDPEWGPPVSAWRADQADDFTQIIDYLSLGLLGIAAITLTTGLLGVLNVGLVTVRERRRELATYRALGASSFTLFVAVVTEAVVVSVVAGAIALALCYLLAGVGDVFAAPHLPSDVSILVPPEAVLVGLGSAAFVGLLAGVIPAWRALRASVVAGLRE
ncbi:putative ABC transport system permease protein [Actinorugispora endophytica]|uniref:Putative ABC transport system permease protein n=2 Tax=Actinorugispora endophytica TaxID=1605990 RepID=A0A4R6V375_9ACTN|nr:putative ABC transport system permease protein [Actinorugispora endophytica]